MANESTKGSGWITYSGIMLILVGMIMPDKLTSLNS